MGDRLPHDASAFTQGLIWEKDLWLESTGQYGESKLREVDQKTGKVLRQVALEPRFFGEGLAEVDGKLYQLTWMERTCIVYDRETFKELNRFQYPGEGWGLATDGKWLYMSDGSASIRVIDPETFEVKRRFRVMEGAQAVPKLNELEWIQGEIWANIFQTGWIVRFSPEDGNVIGYVDLGHLPQPEDRHPSQDVLNGIAYNPVDDVVWVTGKYWKALYSFSRHSAVD
jgi:glutamine cyclotransferase